MFVSLSIAADAMHPARVDARVIPMSHTHKAKLEYLIFFLCVFCDMFLLSSLMFLFERYGQRLAN